MFSHLFLTEGNTDSDNQEEDDTSPQPKRQRLGRRIFSIITLKKLLMFSFLNLMLIQDIAKYFWLDTIVALFWACGKKHDALTFSTSILILLFAY